MAAVINDPVTTTDELIPSGETSSYRSNPMKLAEFALSRKVPEYVGRAKAIAKDESARLEGNISDEYAKAIENSGLKLKGSISIGSAVYAVKPGDGSAREQAASCQRVLGGNANFAVEYATKRYRSNLINWGMMPFTTDAKFEVGDIVIVEKVKEGVLSGLSDFNGVIVRDGKAMPAKFSVGLLTPEERDIIEKGCLSNYYKAQLN
jgi:aconitate hydratase